MHFYLDENYAQYVSYYFECNSEHDISPAKKNKNFFEEKKRFVTAFELNNCLKQLK